MIHPLVEDDLLSAEAETIESVLRFAVGELEPASTSARLDAEILLAHALGKNRAYLRAWPESRLDAKQLDNYLTLIEARKKNMPVAYLTGNREFWTGSYAVGPEVLIPRPETELLVEMALDAIPRDRRLSLLELGTGSGIIAVSLAAERPELSIVATDISPAALEIARHNAKRNHVSAIRFLNSDWFEAIPRTRFDIIISNPPYVADDDPHLSQGDLVHEPDIALRSGPTGLEALELIAEQSRDWLTPGGRLLFEHGFNQAEDLQSLLLRLGYLEPLTRADLQGNPRATRSIWPGRPRLLKS